MDTDHDDLVNLITRAKAGDEAAIDSLRRFEDDIRLMVRVRLPRQLRTQFDSMDFVQEVWQSVFRIFNKDPARFAEIQDLHRYLKGVARNKVQEEHRRRTQSQKYNLGREEPLYIKRRGRDAPRDVVAHDPSPSQDAQARDRLAQIVEGQTPKEAEVVELRRQGLTYDEVAARTGLNERTVRRVIDAIRKRIEARDQQ